MSSVCGQLLGWTPLVDENHYDSRAHRCIPTSPSSSSSSLFDSDFNPSHSRSANSRRQHDPGWVARPRNAFIIFRCEYSQIHCRQGRRVRRPPGSFAEPTLSKRAAIAWSQMTAEEKEPYRVRAEEERHEHVRKHPDYRFRPQRRHGAGRRYSLRHSLPSINSDVSYPSPENSPKFCGLPTFSVSSCSVGSRPSTSSGSSEPDPEHRDLVSGRTLPFTYDASESPSDSNVPEEVIAAQCALRQFNSLPTPTIIQSPCPTVARPILLMGWEGQPSASSATTEESLPTSNEEPFGSLSSVNDDYHEAQYLTLQNPDVEEFWTPHLVFQYPLSSGQVYNLTSPCPVVSSYATLADANLCGVGGADDCDYLGST